MSTEPLSHRIYDPADWSSYPFNGAKEARGHHPAQRLPALGKQEVLRREEEVPAWLRSYLMAPPESQLAEYWDGLSPWSRSAAKRLFDCVCILASLPVLVPLMLIIGAWVRLTSPGPVLFLQERVGRNGRPFTIFKFRTMLHAAEEARHPIATLDNQRFTPIGPFLRHWKLDELPQLANVLFGHMSLVGPRPKMPEHAIFDPPCRPGITGLATIVFAREERILSCVARERLDDFFHSVVLPTKRKLDAAYMARANFFSDLRLLVNSVLRRWDTAALDEFIAATTFGAIEEMVAPRASHPAQTGGHSLVPSPASQQMEAEEVSTS